MVDSDVWEGVQEREGIEDGGVVGELEMKGRPGSLSRPMKRFGNKERTKMAIKRRVEVAEDG